jgi:hypothetical protein
MVSRHVLLDRGGGEAAIGHSVFFVEDDEEKIR